MSCQFSCHLLYCLYSIYQKSHLPYCSKHITSGCTISHLTFPFLSCRLRDCVLLHRHLGEIIRWQGKTSFLTQINFFRLSTSCKRGSKKCPSLKLPRPELGIQELLSALRHSSTKPINIIKIKNIKSVWITIFMFKNTYLSGGGGPIGPHVLSLLDVQIDVRLCRTYVLQHMRHKCEIYFNYAFHDENHETSSS